MRDRKGNDPYPRSPALSWHPGCQAGAGIAAAAACFSPRRERRGRTSATLRDAEPITCEFRWSRSGAGHAPAGTLELALIHLPSGGADAACVYHGTGCEALAAGAVCAANGAGAVSACVGRSKKGYADASEGAGRPCVQSIAPAAWLELTVSGACREVAVAAVRSGASASGAPAHSDAFWL